MTEDKTAAVDAPAAGADAPAEADSDLKRAISRRDNALGRAQTAEAELAKLKAAVAEQDRKKLEEQGEWQALAKTAEASAADLKARLGTIEADRDKLAQRYRTALTGRLEALPDTAKATIAERLGESPALNDLESAISLAETFQGTGGAPTPRAHGGSPAGGKTKIRSGSKLSAAELQKLTRAERAEYLRAQY